MKLSSETEIAVKRFNLLPRKPRLPSGSMPNIWHIDLRYILANPPSHGLFFLQPDAHFVHLEKIEEDVILRIPFFPETAKEAAPLVARTIIDAFNGESERYKTARLSPFGAPWAITTEDPILARELANEFKSIGVQEDRCNILSTSSAAICSQAHLAFGSLHDRLKTLWDYKPAILSSLRTPRSITFPPVDRAEIVGSWKGYLNQDRYFKIVYYANTFSESCPPGAIDADVDGFKVFADIEGLQKRFEAVPEIVVRREADAGNGLACLDYAMRLTFGIDCQHDRLLSRVYLIKALRCKKAMNESMKATTHALLMVWFLSGRDDDIHPQYVASAWHEAEEAITISRKCTKNNDLPAAPVIRMFGVTVFDKMAKPFPVLPYLYPKVWETMEERRRQLEEEDMKNAKKRLKSPHKYRCAAEKCMIRADSKGMLRACGGKCDADKKPSYCSKECQRADWPNHKPYCKPGAECSVIDDGSYNATSSSGTANAPALKLPVNHADGTVTYLTSSDLGPDVLKKLKTRIEMLSALGVQTATDGSTIELSTIPGTSIISCGNGSRY